MASKYWIKLYHELLDDPKIGRLTDSQFRLTINLFLLAGDCDQDGYLPSIDDIRWRLRDPDHFDDDLQALKALGILEDEDGVLLVSKFADRQGAMTAEDRSRRCHERARRSDYYTHASDPRSARNAHDSCIDVDKDEDVDKDTDKELDADADGSHPEISSIVNPHDELIECFIDQSGIPINTGGQHKWSLALSRLRSVGVTPDDLITALSECRQKNLVIASLASIVNPAIIAMFRHTGSRASPSNPAEQGLIGHSDIQILKRYLKQTNQDMHKAQIKGSPVTYLRL